jgi:SNF2 family DNA or RNA helicase
VFGTITYTANRWAIRCEPHVRTRLKRLFPRAPQSAGELITISDNAEHCRDLLWFLQRYPMSVSDQARLEDGARRHVEEQTAVEALLENRRQPDSFALAIPPRAYQAEAASLCVIKGGLLCADDVGLGKTVTAICAMANKENLPALVVTLTHLTGQWRDEIARFAPNLKTHILSSAKPYDLTPREPRIQTLFDDDRTPDVIITNYHKLSGWADTLAGFMKYVVFDEAQELRREDSKKYVAAEFVANKARLRMGLSATPIYNYGAEFFSVLNVLRPDGLGTKQEFMREWCSHTDRLQAPRVFGEYLRREALMIRRTRSEVGRELPPVNKIPHTVASDEDALDAIKSSAVELARTILKSREDFRGQKRQSAQEFDMLMRQATGIAKAPHVAAFVRMLVESGEQVVLFGWHRDVYTIWLELLKDLSPLLFTGTETALQKAQAKKDFVEGKCRVLIISLRSGAGLDGLQAVCSTAVFGELDWSPGVHEQCVGRIARDGQMKPVMAYFLLAEDGSDPIVSGVLGLKRGQVDGARDPNAALIEALDVDAGNVRTLALNYLARVGESHP